MTVNTNPTISGVGGLSVVTTAGGKVIVSSNGVSIPVSTALRNEALTKFFGAARSGRAFNDSTGLSALSFSTGVKMEVEAPFNGAQFLWINRTANAVNGNKLIVGVTETNDTSTSNNRCQVVIGGTAYAQLAPAGTINGFRSVTWAGAATIDLPAATSAQQFKLSDWINLTTVPRADGGTRPLFLWRSWHDGTAQSFAFNVIGAGLDTPSAAQRNRTIQVVNAFSDAIATINTSMSAGTSFIENYPIIRYSVPVLSVWDVGDSTQQNDALVANLTSSWIYRACLSASTLTRPVVYANMAMSSQTSTTYWSTCKNLLATGIAPPSVLIIGPGSVNDDPGNVNTIITQETQLSRAHEILDTCKLYGIPWIIWREIWPYNVLDAAHDNLRKQTNTLIAALAASYGIGFILMSELGDGATPERWVPAYNFSSDGIHPNETCIDTVLAPKMSNILLKLMGVS